MPTYIFHTTKHQVLLLMEVFATATVKNNQLIWTVPTWLEHMLELSHNSPT